MSQWADPTPHSSGARPPDIPADLLPGHIAIVMDGNGRWARQRGLPRTKGHEAGEAALELGLRTLSVYAFSTENWKRSPDEVRFLMSFNRDVIHNRRDELHEMGVRVRWAGRRPRLWRSVIAELEAAAPALLVADRGAVVMRGEPLCEHARHPDATFSTERTIGSGASRRGLRGVKMR